VTGFQVNPTALGVTADGVQGVLDELGQLGINGEQTSGSPVTNLALPTPDSGDEVMSMMLDEVLGRAHYVLRDLLGNAQQMVTRLRTNQTHYQQVEHAITAKFTDLSNALMGAPSTGGAW
jgi:hypothetical protein